MVMGDAKVSDREKFISGNRGKVMGKWSKRLEDFTPTYLPNTSRKDSKRMSISIEMWM